MADSADAEEEWQLASWVAVPAVAVVKWAYQLL
jgi:hypothetical protein